MWVSGPSRVSTWPCQVGWCCVQSGAHVPSGGEQVERATPCLGLGDPATSHLLQVLLCRLPTSHSVPEVYRPGFIQAQCLPTTQRHGHSLNCGIFQILGFAKMLTVKYRSLWGFVWQIWVDPAIQNIPITGPYLYYSLLDCFFSFNIKCLPWSLKRQKCWTSKPAVFVLEFEAPKMTTRT